MKKASFLITLALLMLIGVTFADDIVVKRNGELNWLGLKFTPTVIYGPQWNSAVISPASISDKDGISSASHEIMVGGQDAGTLDWQLQKGGDCFDITWKFNSSEPRITNRFVDMMVPVVDAASFTATTWLGMEETIVFNAGDKKQNLWRKIDDTVKSLTLKLKNGTAVEFTLGEGVHLVVQDNRPWNVQSYSIRFELEADYSAIQLKAQANFSAVYPLDIRHAANRTYGDEVSGDKKGGWTDQGSGNDMSCFKEKKVSYRGIPFDIVDEQNKTQNSVIVVAGEVRNMAPREITLTVPKQAGRVAGISILHASGWVDVNKIGEIFIRYADTGTQTIEVMGGRDVGNWWVGGDLSNGKIAWSSSNGIRTVGLYCSSFELGGAEPVSITFRVTNPEAIWMISAVTLTERPMLMPEHVARPWIAEENPNWHVVNYKRCITPGSPLDFSRFIPHRPAGKYGHAIPNAQGKLVFEKAPDQVLRMNGTNIGSDTLFPSREDAEKIAEFLAACGINAVRLHAIDRCNEFLPPSEPKSSTINLKNLDKLEYFIAQLEKNGIYLTTDLFASRIFRDGDNVAHLEPYKGMDSRAAVQFDDAAYESWKALARNWLLHKNPYTGMTLAEDPAMVFVNLSNEDTIGNEWNHVPGSATYRFICDKYAAWCAEHPEANPKPVLGNPDYMKFIYTQSRKRSLEMMDFLRNELGVKFHITSANNGGNVASTWLRDVYDIVDDHIYSDHPMFPVKAWEHPMQMSQNCVINGNAWVPLLLLKGRIYGKPFVITEVDFTYPNMYRNEEGPLMGAYCALQDIDGIFYFGFAGSIWRATNKQRRICAFESCYDAVKQQTYRLTAAFFLRGDVQSAPQKVGYTIPRDLFRPGVDFGYPQLNASGLISQLGVVFDDRPVADVMDHNAITDPLVKQLNDEFKATGRAKSATGEIMIEAKKQTLQVSAVKSASVTLPAGASASDGKLKVAKSSVFQTIAAVSLDDKPLEASDSVIVMQTTNMDVVGSRFADQDRRRQENLGMGDLLLERGIAEVTLECDGPRRVVAVDFQGDALGELPAQYHDGKLSFTADNFKFVGGIAGYHLTRLVP